ncbi:MAG: C39 family peptidase [Thiohalocapsa sp.]
MTLRVSGRAFACIALALSLGPSAAAWARPPVRSLAEIRYDHVVHQKWDLSCGAAALATLFTYDLGHPLGEVEIARSILQKRDPARVNKQGGFSLLDLQEVAEAHGYEADGYGKLTIADLQGMLPAIVPLELYRGDHFVVVRAVRDGEVFFADPAFGNRSLSLADFAKFWVQKVGFVVHPRS